MKVAVLGDGKTGSAVQNFLNQQLNKLIETEQGLTKTYAEIQAEEATLVASLSEKYGNGQLDPETGVFTPNS